MEDILSKKKGYMILYCGTVVEDGLEEVDLEMAITRCGGTYDIDDLYVYEVIPVDFKVQSRVVISPRT